MKLITHNILMCNKKGCTQNNFPLRLICNTYKDLEGDALQPYNPQLLQRLMEKLDWNALRMTVHNLNWGIDLPEQVDPQQLENEKLLQDLYSLLIKRQIVEGQMICPNCERVYEIKNGIPNMLLREDEV